MSQTGSPSAATASPRLHDLDALRASAMLLGIVYHIALSFALGFGWMVQDVSQSSVWYVFQFWTHGFRMQLFFLISGFFTAMLWRKRGLGALLWHRCRRILFPCLLGLITVVPAMIWASGYAARSGAEKRQARVAAQSAPDSLWSTIRSRDTNAVLAALERGADLNETHVEYGVTPLTLAALIGDDAVAALLLQHGAAVDARSRDGGTALMAAAFLGRTGVVESLLTAGADVNASNYRGDTALNAAKAPWGLTAGIARGLQLPFQPKQIAAGRAAIVNRLEALGAAEKVAAPAAAPADETRAEPGPFKKALLGLMYRPVFILIWFLWFLVWLVALFAVYAFVADRFGWKRAPRRLLLSPWNLLWLVPLTLLPQSYMGQSNGGFGPDISMGILPIPHILLYYALFFGFGVLYYDCQDQERRLGRNWRILLPLATLVVFPLGLEFATGRFGFRDVLLPAEWHRRAADVFQVLYAWMMCFGCMGMFHALLTRENKTIRYLSDSSYWLYLAHLPLVIVAQTLVSDWPLPAWFKLGLISVVLTGFLLLTYDKLVRYTPIGTLLNGKRTRPVPPESPPMASLSTSS